MLIVALGGAQPALRAQSIDTLFLGDARMISRAIPIGTYSILSEMERAGNRSSSASTRTVTDTTVAGIPAYHFLTEAGSSVYHLIVRKSDLAPLGFRQRTDRDSAEVWFDGVRVQGWRASAAGREDLHLTLKGAPVMDAVIPDVIARLPLEAGLETCVYSYHPFTGEGCLPVRVVGQGTFPGDSLKTDAWEVESVAEVSQMTFTRTWWISTATGRPLGSRLVGSNGVSVHNRLVPAT